MRNKSVGVAMIGFDHWCWSCFIISYIGFLSLKIYSKKEKVNV